MNIKVIVFDDDPHILKLLTLIVNKRGYEAMNYREPTLCPLYGNSTCNCPRETPCADIIITDNHMPNMTGLEFIRQQQLRECKGLVKYKAVMSGSWAPEELELANSLGCKIFTKPVCINDLYNWMEECEKMILEERKERSSGTR
jgi:CheY-like chemotaxis protein